jgi:hypothetical protein
MVPCTPESGAEGYMQLNIKNASFFPGASNKVAQLCNTGYAVA